MFPVADEMRLAYIAETAWGTTPATPAFTKLRNTGESFKVVRNKGKSTELDPSRNVKDMVTQSGGASGGFNFELSYGTYDNLLESLFHAAWANNVLKNGRTPKSFTFEKGFYKGQTSGADVYSFFRYLGMEVNSMSLAISANAFITGSFDFLGKGGSVSDTIITGATYLDGTTAKIMSASHDVGTITLGSLTSPQITAVNLTVNNNLAGAGVVGSVDYAQIRPGKCDVSGDCSVYFEDESLYEAYLNDDSAAITLNLGSTTLQKYTLTLPKVIFSDGDVAASGENSYIIAKMPFTAIYDATEACTIKLTRAVA